MKKVVFVINSLRGGGAERLLQSLSREMISRGIKVVILSLEAPHVAYQYPSEVEIIPFWTRGLNRGFMKILALPLFALELRIRLILLKPDGWMSLLFRANFVAALTKLYGYRGPIIISEHSDILRAHPGNHITNRAMRELAGILYRCADHVVVVSTGIQATLTRLGIPESRIRLVYNAVDVEQIRQEASQAPGAPLTFVTVGRLSPEKDHATLLGAFSKVAAWHQGVKLVIVGEGAGREQLQAQITSLNLGQRASLVGWKAKPYVLIGKSLAFVLSSRFEGFGLVLVEAMVAGLPVISTDCTGGPGEILGDGEYGILVPPEDAEALASAMKRLLESPSLCEELRRKGWGRCLEFDVRAVCDSYLALLFG